MSLQNELERLLHRLMEADGLLGVALISRDGLLVKAAGRPEMHRETFSAMTATLMGAAEIALAELDSGGLDMIVASTGRVRMVLLGATRDLLLVASVASDAPTTTVLPHLQEGVKAVAALIER